MFDMNEGSDIKKTLLISLTVSQSKLYFHHTLISKSQLLANHYAYHGDRPPEMIGQRQELLKRKARRQ